MKPSGSKTKAQVWMGEHGKVRSRSDQLATVQCVFREGALTYWGELTFLAS
ncbi:hypothetical protein [Allocoleopsis sp.]|uniref:hypothetical protein n=1 Tax=Allocoleopsis sp. TaxID=3088169 RepID=UPI002FCEAC5E